MEQELEEGDIVMCTVDRIAGTVVFVKIHINNKEIEGSIITSEIAPGRIRNIRDYVIPKKEIVCKVLRISKEGINLSLRRVTPKEKKEAIEYYKKEKSYKDILKSIIGEKYKQVVQTILNEQSIYDFLEESKDNPKRLEKLIGADYTKKILEILKNQKAKKAVIKKIILLTTTKPNGVSLIKELLDIKEAEIKYLSGGKYSIKTQAKDIKTADNNLKNILKELEKKAKEQGAELIVKEK